MRLAQRRRDEREVGVSVEDVPVEALVDGDVEIRVRLVDALEQVAERRRAVAASLIAAFEALDQRRDTAAPEDIAAVIDPVFAFLRGGLAALTKRPS